jgi:hypothetical protein
MAAGGSGQNTRPGVAPSLPILAEAGRDPLSGSQRMGNFRDPLFASAARRFAIRSQALSNTF